MPEAVEKRRQLYKQLLSRSLSLMQEEDLSPEEAVAEAKRELAQSLYARKPKSFLRDHAISLGAAGLLAAASFAFWLAFKRRVPPRSIVESLRLEGKGEEAARALEGVVSLERRALPPAKEIDEFGNAIRVLENEGDVIPGYGKTVGELADIFIGELNKRLARSKRVLSAEEAENLVFRIADRMGYKLEDLDRYGLLPMLKNEAILRSALAKEGVKLSGVKYALAEFMKAYKTTVRRTLTRSKDMRRAAEKLLSGVGIDAQEAEGLAQTVEHTLSLLAKARKAKREAAVRVHWRDISEDVGRKLEKVKSIVEASSRKFEKPPSEEEAWQNIYKTLTAFQDEGYEAAVRKTKQVLKNVYGEEAEKLFGLVDRLARIRFKRFEDVESVAQRVEDWLAKRRKK